MQFKILVSLSLVVIATIVLGGCAKTNYDGSTRVQPFSARPDTEPTPNAIPQEEPKSPPVGPIISGNLPVISFVQNEVLMDGRLEARLELQLSEASKQPVTAVVSLVDGTAFHYRDFSGFKVRSSETTQTVVLPPGTTRMALPVIGGRRTRFCDTYFNAVLNAKRLQNARVVNNSAKIILPCEFVEPAPIVEPPLPVQPCPMVNARFESDVIEAHEHAKRASVKIVLDRPSDLPVIFNLETNDISAFDKIDYVKVKVQLTIPAGQTSIELPIELIKNKRCRTADMHRWQQHGKFEFRTVVTAMSNAIMLQPSALIIFEKDVDDEGCISAPGASVK